MGLIIRDTVAFTFANIRYVVRTFLHSNHTALRHGLKFYILVLGEHVDLLLQKMTDDDDDVHNCLLANVA